MSKEIVINPLVGIEWEDKKINLGDSLDTVKEVLGDAEVRYENSAYYFSTDLRIDYDADCCVEFIEFLGGEDGSVQPVVYGEQVFQINAAKVYRILKEHSNGHVIDEEDGFSYRFPKLGLEVYRENTPDAIDITITKLREKGIEVVDNANLMDERHRASRWATIGMGTKEYFK